MNKTTPTKPNEIDNDVIKTIVFHEGLLNHVSYVSVLCQEIDTVYLKINFKLK